MSKHTYTWHTDKNYIGSAEMLSKIDQKKKKKEVHQRLGYERHGK